MKTADTAYIADTAGTADTAAPPRAAAVAAGRRGHLVADLRAVRVLWQREVIRFGRNRLRIAMSVIMPMMFLLVFGTGLNAAVPAEQDAASDFRAFFFPGVLLMAVQAPAMAAGASIVWDRQAGFLRQLLVAPVRRPPLLTGTCLGGATAGLGYALPVLCLAGLVGIPYRPELFLVLAELALIAFAFTSLGVLVAVCAKRPETFQIVIGLCMMPLLFLSGAVFPASGLPGWLGTVVGLNPLTYAVDALRRTLPGEGVSGLGNRAAGPQWGDWTPSVPAELGCVAVLAALTLAVATYRFARSE
ncbi:ABC transporter permease [Streptomyces silvensis]|uniref:ABC transporter permease n=1 Tax=Streptomyces silvensis TaxID=1765722 RepID=UPI000AF66D00|nr:ABC transporter permease [Streptomyces silvensis]